MELLKVVEHLETKLHGPLPGKKGQIIMAPQPLDEARFANQNVKNARKGAVMILLYRGKDGCMVPFIKRPEYEGNHSGQVSFPGGKWEEDDINLQETALRETEEEIGVDKNQINIIGKMSNLYIPPSNFLVTPYIGFSEKTPNFKPDPREVSRIIHSDFAALIDQKNIKETSFKLASGFNLKAPYFDIEKEVVWGATAMILGELMAIWKS
ncbi:NUDIX hydrolase [Echinicola shivajiensis]|uniref:NUDIX hydrolase n=1 Tax=Echinicola shivajiensis TaxID=1035916 RepID=UPI001BFCB900|nr:CoA pyrophosphatase [Echinicola shivajiensis]